MITREKELRKYFRQVMNRIPGCGKWRKQFSRQLNQRISDFLEEQPDADMEQIVRHFGTPQQIAEAYVQEMDAGTVLQKLHVGNRIVRMVAVALFVALTLIAAALVISMADIHNSATYSYETHSLEG